MNPIRYLLPFLLVCLPALAWPADAGRYPIRQIDRPLILPKRMWQERLVWNQDVPVEERSDGDVEKIQGFLPSLPVWSITDNLSWEAVPFPLFRYLVTRNNVREGRPVVDDFSLTLDGGLNGFVYSSRDGTIIASVAGLSFKLPWSGRMWSEGSGSVGFENEDPSYSVAGLGLGLQVTGRSHAVAGYTASMDLDGEYPLYHGFSLQWGTHFHPGLSLDFRFTYTVGNGDSWLSPGSTLSFQW